MIKAVLFELLICGFVLFPSSNAKNIGDECLMNDGKQQGICTDISKCSSDLFGPNDSLSYTKCDVDNFFIICCPRKYALSDTTETSVDTRVGEKRISEKKCEEYSSAVYVKSVFLPLSAGATGIVTQKTQCKHQVQALVVGGEHAGVGEFPHMALLGYVVNSKTEWNCGGSLISDEYVLTAAHCFTEGDPKVVRLGELNYESTTDGADPKDFEISSLIPHPKYDVSSTYYDIGLARLAKKVRLTPDIRPACLPTSPDLDQRMIATGWGNTDFAASKSAHLLKVVLEKFSGSECGSSYREDSVRLPNGLKSSQFCAGHRTESKDTCNGDSGGPLQNYHKNLYCMYTLFGITSFGQGCATIGVPAVYTQIYSFIDWIESNVWA